MKKLNQLLTVGILFIAGIINAQMMLEYHVEAGDTVGLPLNGTVNVTVNWGDGSVESFNTAEVQTHIYDVAGPQTVTITGSLTHFGSPAIGTGNLELTKVHSWDGLGLTDLSYAFYGAKNLIEVPSILPTSGVTDLTWMFYTAFIFNQDIKDWDVSTVTKMSHMFNNARAFDQDIEDWDVSNVTHMGGMFASAYDFNQPLNEWDVYNVINMSYMFTITGEFNQPLDEWEVYNVINMEGMFDRTHAFNQPLDAWDVSNVLRMKRMFWNAKVFNQSLASWDISGAGTMENMMTEVTLCTDNYDATLISWAAQLSNSSKILDFDGGFSQYSSASEVARMTLDKNTWTDGGFTNSPVKCPATARASAFAIAEEFTADLISVFPNPAQDVLHIDWSAMGIESADVEILSSNGLLVDIKHIDSSTGDFIDVSVLDRGAYILNVKTEGDSFVKRFVKQ